MSRVRGCLSAPVDFIAVHAGIITSSRIRSGSQPSRWQGLSSVGGDLVRTNPSGPPKSPATLVGVSSTIKTTLRFEDIYSRSRKREAGIVRRLGGQRGIDRLHDGVEGIEDSSASSTPAGVAPRFRLSQRRLCQNGGTQGAWTPSDQWASRSAVDLSPTASALRIARAAPACRSANLRKKDCSVPRLPPTLSSPSSINARNLERAAIRISEGETPE